MIPIMMKNIPIYFYPLSNVILSIEEQKELDDLIDNHVNACDIVTQIHVTDTSYSKCYSIIKEFANNDYIIQYIHVYPAIDAIITLYLKKK